ncbi:helix-turn-helix domain-containing protein [Jiella avicenniae]|uniref:Helix-turn-helix domain-containing protein n=1 Tax=Jiella avicenniae TaxID=2907202 RepID=A0A9X1T4K5_9HYPH|nr:helix-turn-helix domain-containing protein [Jiella avicenniae]MCE7028047.1 helix-turn-helix domain-containing protein [Jiella avicenniae]
MSSTAAARTAIPTVDAEYRPTSSKGRSSATFAAFGSSPGGETQPAGESQGRAAGTALAGQVLSFAEGREIYAEGDTVRSFYKVMHGVVRTCRFTSDGRRQIDGFHAEGEIFGLETGGEHRLSAEAVTDCCVVAYRWSGLDAFDGGEGATALTVFGFAMTCLKRSQAHALLLGRRSAAQKLASFLLDWAGRGTGECVDLAMTRQDIADYLGLTIETVSRTMSQFERDKLIALPSSRHVVLRNRAALQDLVD